MTLIEIIVVLLVAGLVVSIALPGLSRVLDTHRVKGERARIIQSLDTLSLRSYTEGRPLVLNAGTIPNLPAGWTLEVPVPVEFAVNGLCTSGTLVLTPPQGTQETYHIAPPHCRPTPANAIAP